MSGQTRKPNVVGYPDLAGELRAVAERMRGGDVSAVTDGHALLVRCGRLLSENLDALPFKPSERARLAETFVVDDAAVVQSHPTGLWIGPGPKFDPAFPAAWMTAWQFAMVARLVVGMYPKRFGPALAEAPTFEREAELFAAPNEVNAKMLGDFFTGYAEVADALWGSRSSLVVQRELVRIPAGYGETEHEVRLLRSRGALLEAGSVAGAMAILLEDGHPVPKSTLYDHKRIIEEREPGLLDRSPLNSGRAGKSEK